MSNRIPLHPGEFIRRVYIEENGITQTALAEGLDINKGTLSRLLNGQTDVMPAMAIKLSVVLGRSAQSWLNMQSAHSLAKAQAVIGSWKPKLILNKGELVPPKNKAAVRRAVTGTFRVNKGKKIAASKKNGAAVA